MISKTLATKFALILFMAGMLAGCGAITNTTPQPLPTVVLGSDTVSPTSPQEGGGVVASGVVAPAQEAQLASALAATVESLNVTVGDSIEGGQVLVLLAGREKLAAAIESAKLEVLSAQQALDALYKDMDIQQAQALKAIADNQDAVRDAERTLLNLHSQSRQVDIDAAYANMILTKDKLDRVRKDYRPYENKSEDNVVRAALLSRLAQAEKDYNAAVQLYNNLLGTANPIDLSQAEADLAMAQARLAKSQRDYESLQQGPDPDEVALAETRLSTAKAQLTAAEASLKDLEIKAPINGTITQLHIHAGEWVTPGQPLLLLSDLGNLQVETTDLSERDVNKIIPGQTVSVFITALDQDVAGKVNEIAPLADTLGGDVVYRTTIDLDEFPEGLRAGMSVEVQFGTQE